ncbi:tRNA lysidine(34) synthetase TilS [Brevundimonas sp.]|uniref:tRNA lysidine(34) synthetase TilS n=1 Tax=Brevundimonas sp. TaxID=1871086 RepID=UPI002730EE91|nr:tRNA lysidine(34) synthetase TilS [Brevundimonas sp.]MDP1912033.1 tRNA lysidine(34) synthetase TilS [Brevundimonas sp.]
MDRPLALALSGGGDSLALLRLAADWARANGRRLLALTVDHGLSPDSAAWTAFAERAAREAGADWRGLCWTGPKPATGLPAAARMARHRLIAEAARKAGARVVLFAHTADDIAEGEVMRAEGSTLGRLRDWSPSPAWPEGRGLMLLRPMLGAGRGEVRDWLAGQGAGWIDDPGNEDPRFARSRARRSLYPLPLGEGGTRPATAGWEDEGLRRQETRPPDPLTLKRKDDGSAAVRSSPLPMGEGSFNIGRDTDAASLAAALVCVGGGDRLPRRDRLDAIHARLAGGEDFTATLCGARIEARGDQTLLIREAGEFIRRPRPPLPLIPGVETVWDGRWAITADSPGWSVAPAAGRMAALSDADRAVLKALPPAARGSMPVLIRNNATAPVLAGRAAKARSLVEQRLALALDRMTHERDLGGALHGASPRNHLFSGADITDERALRRTQGTRRE